MIVDLPTPCFGKSELFDSTHEADHKEARALCRVCPELAKCKAELRAVSKAAANGGGPEGTWAGKLVGPRPARRNLTPEEIAEQDALYTDAEMREAHRQHNRGIRTEWALTGHRVYERSRKRRRDTDTAA